MEKIGNVILNDRYYEGKDLYSDGAIEDRILELVEKYPEEEYNQLIAKERDWAVMYHLAHERENILSWYPFERGTKVLEIGSGCGAVTGVAASKAGTVTCVDLSMKRSRINGVRNQKKGNIEIFVGNFQDIEKGLEKDFDYATLIGVFEYGQAYIGGKKPYHEFLTTILNHLKPGGKLLIAIENKFGLKYWAGCTEDHTGNFFEGLEGYRKKAGVRTFTKPELEHILKECGCYNYKFYYPYPDYKFPFMIYSDEYLPKPGELNRNLCNFDRRRLMLMDEGKVFDQILENGLFPLYSNSFFVEIVKDKESEDDKVKKITNPVIYMKYSAGRAPRFSLRTGIERDEVSSQSCIGKGEMGKLLYKKPEYPEGRKHMANMVEAKDRLEELWQEKGLLLVNQCKLIGEKVSFAYLEGMTLEEKLDRLLEQEEEEEAAELLEQAINRIKESSSVQKFSMTPEFRQVFGEVSGLEQELSFPVSDIDLIFSNILLTEDGNWHVLDYEWTFAFPVPVDYIIYRALHYYLEASGNRKKLKEDYNFYKIFGITKEKKKIYRVMERNFQNYITGTYIPVRELYPMIGKKAFPLGEILAEADKRRMQIYVDDGHGFSEEHSFFIDQGYGGKVSCRVPVPEKAQKIWIDPALAACILQDVKLRWRGKDGGEMIPVKYTTTGFMMEKNCFLFDNSDPKIIIEEIPKGKCQIDISYQISILEEKTAGMLMDKVNPKGQMKKRVRRLIGR
ncbi:hypothetical protein C806_01849 [Lachnospiraceae bacterium 3-1]|nr:hypothetical protein C806_01849 [Lachnospiraceae bacterium 3-1]